MQMLNWVQLLQSLHSMRFFFGELFFLSVFGNCKIGMSLYIKRKVTPLAQRDVKCQVLTSVLPRHPDTQWNRLF